MTKGRIQVKKCPFRRCGAGSNSTLASRAHSGRESGACPKDISATLQQPRNERPRLASIRFVVWTEGVLKVCLFQSDLAPVCESRHREPEHRVHLPGYDSRTGEHPQPCGVDRMPHESIGTGSNQPVIDLDGDLSAPMASENPPSPNSQRSRRRLNAKTGPNGKRCVRQKSLA